MINSDDYFDAIKNIHGDLTDRTFNRLYIKGYGFKKNGLHYWECECICPKKAISFHLAYEIVSGRVKSCGCYNRERSTEVHFKNQTGVDCNGVIIGERLPPGTDSKHVIYNCTCPYCAKVFTARAADIKRKRVKSCGCKQQEIAAMTRRENQEKRGEKFNNNRRYDIKKFSDWRCGAMERDHFTCVVCGKKSENIEVHHMNGWHWAEDERYDQANSATICCSGQNKKNELGCHEKFHAIYGKYYNTKEQFEEFKIGFKVQQNYLNSKGFILGRFSNEEFEGEIELKKPTREECFYKFLENVI